MYRNKIQDPTSLKYLLSVKYLSLLFLGEYRAAGGLPEGRSDVRQCVRVDIQRIR